MSDTRTYYYARVSSRDQNLARQLEAFRVLGADERSIITDQESGKDLNRPGYMALKNTILRPGDTLVITSLDRLSRRKADIETELRWFREQRIRLKILDLPTTMAEQERLRTRQRQAEGYAAARAAGRKMGRPRLARPPQWPEIYAAWQAGELTAKEAAQRLGIGRSTLYKLASEK